MFDSQRSVMPRLLLLAAASMLMAAGPAPAPVPAPLSAPAPTAAPIKAGPNAASGPVAAGAVPVPLSRQPRTWMDTAARRLMVQDFAEARRAGEIPLLLVGSARLGSAAGDRAALFVQLQSPRECGSGGCNTSVFVWRNGQWGRVLDGVSGKLSVARARTRGMADLLTDTEHYAWTGTEYRDVNPAPQIDLRPRRR